MRIAVAMSGGVDSSVAALLLREQGHEVIGLSMQLWDHSGEPGRSGRCCTLDDLSDARRVAWSLGIRHYVLNLEDEFARHVVRPFVESYLAGETPIPCSSCNAKIKFATLWERARGLGCEAVATGHYVRAEDDPVSGRRLLRKGLDPSKDQSYFLYDLTPPQLSAARFPVGSLTKSEVRAHAHRANLPTADKEESQEICFVPPGTRAGEFVAREAGALGLALPAAPGRIENARGETLGSHQGHFRFTIGQRRGIGVAASGRRGIEAAASGRRGIEAAASGRRGSSGAASERLYVLAVDAGANRVVVGSAGELDTREALLGELRLLSPARPAPFRASARVRHRAAEVPATVYPDGRGNARVVFDSPVRAVTPGQSCVFYEGDVVLGGGVIRKKASGPAVEPRA